MKHLTFALLVGAAIGILAAASCSKAPEKQQSQVLQQLKGPDGKVIAPSNSPWGNANGGPSPDRWLEVDQDGAINMISKATAQDLERLWMQYRSNLEAMRDVAIGRGETDRVIQLNAKIAVVTKCLSELRKAFSLPLPTPSPLGTPIQAPSPIQTFRSPTPAPKATPSPGIHFPLVPPTP